ncbi:hypothetical protein SAICODRAFT_6839 [Saitoella complicata NRRL Y-17804]|nr:uncharacterized protein SAICODRAFT_6839 [Saitoella complicata NRRL Y-17804]ODQ53579.1 hypothetical protein SAICODRAFT_6839 [Saitoella complicata NRRL Y-17804]
MHPSQNIPPPLHLSPNSYPDMASPALSYEGPLYTPLLPAGLLLGSPFQPPTPGFLGGWLPMSPGLVQGGPLGQEIDTGSRTIYLGNLPRDIPLSDILSHIHPPAALESIRFLPEKSCLFLSFANPLHALHFHTNLRSNPLVIRGQEVKIGWGRSSQLSATLQSQIEAGATRCVFLGGLEEGEGEDEIREELGRFGQVEHVRIITEKGIGFVHFLSVATAVRCVQLLPVEGKWTGRRIGFGRDRCAFVQKTAGFAEHQQPLMAGTNYGLGTYIPTPATNSSFDTTPLASSITTNTTATNTSADPLGLSNLLGAVNATSLTTMGSQSQGNRTVYLGHIPPSTELYEILNVVRGGILENVRYLPEKHICFLTFVEPAGAANFYANATSKGRSGGSGGLVVRNKRLRIGWGKYSGPLTAGVALAVAAGATRNVYVGNLEFDENPEMNEETISRLRADFEEFGEIELVNSLPEKSCAWVNFTSILNAWRAVEGIRGRDTYRRQRVSFGKDRCGNAPRQQRGGGEGDSGMGGSGEGDSQGMEDSWASFAQQQQLGNGAFAAGGLGIPTMQSLETGLYGLAIGGAEEIDEALNGHARE